MAISKLIIEACGNQISKLVIAGSGKSILNALLLAMEDNEHLRAIIQQAAELTTNNQQPTTKHQVI